MMNVVIKLFLFTTVSVSTYDSFAFNNRKIDRIMSRYSGNVPGASVLVVRNGQKVFAKSYGIVDMTSKTKIKPTSSFRLASLTKQFTAMAILILIDRGKLSLDTKLHDIFGQFPAYAADIRIKHLLYHQSGLRRYEKNIPRGFIGQLSDGDVFNILSGLSSKLFSAGKKYKYSNSGYSLLASIVERVSGIGFSKFLQQELFKPLGMKSAVAHIEGQTLVINRVFGHTRSGGKIILSDQNRFSAVLGDGGIYMSIEDYFLWDQEVSQGSLLSKKMHKLLGLRAKLNNGTRSNYAMGWRVGLYRSEQLWHHTGSSIGFKNIILRFPQKAVSVLVLTNRSNQSPNSKAYEIADLVLAETP